MVADAAASAPIVVAITGASGFQYGLRLLQCLVAARQTCYVMVSRAALAVADVEAKLALAPDAAGLQRQLEAHCGAAAGQLQVFDREDWMAPPASGSGRWRAMVVCPCSTGTLSAIANGASNNLIERAADVAIKERKQLILTPRETPLSAIHLENMLKLSRLGVVILPASPGFYQRPQSVADMIDFIVARILNQLGIEHSLLPAWGETAAGPARKPRSRTLRSKSK
jgi:4-hydroxy-3-polyprenylbenzoate decarboxylase